MREYVIINQGNVKEARTTSFRDSFLYEAAKEIQRSS